MAQHKQEIKEEFAPRLLSVRQVAAMLGLHHQTIYNQVSRGAEVIKSVRVGNKRMFLASDVEAFFERLGAATAQPPTAPREPRRGRPRMSATLPSQAQARSES